VDLLDANDVCTSIVDLGRDDAYRNFLDGGRGGAIPTRGEPDSVRTKSRAFTDSYEVVRDREKKCEDQRGN
jgi:hypothetical protein